MAGAILITSRWRESEHTDAAYVSDSIAKRATDSVNVDQLMSVIDQLPVCVAHR